MNPQPKKIPERSLKRLEFVRQMPCLILEYGQNSIKPWRGHVMSDCWPRIEAHHIRKDTNSGTGTKPSDSRIVPLCEGAHLEYHRIGHAPFEAKYGLDLIAHADRIDREFRAAYPVQRKRAVKPKRLVKKELGWAVVNPLGKMQHVHLSKAVAVSAAYPECSVERVEIRRVR